MNFKKLTIQKINKFWCDRANSSNPPTEITEVVMIDNHSEVATRFIARVQKRVLDTGIELKEGEEYDVGLSLRCREYEGKYYNELSIWSMTPATL